MNATQQINTRYSALAKKTTCLSCGGAINHAAPRCGETCVDLGSGRGNDVINLARAVGPAGVVFGIDISEGMIARARHNVSAEGISNAYFERSPIERIPLERNTVDVLISNCTINHADSKSAVWSEVFRVLRPGGRFVVSDIYSLEPVPETYQSDPEAVAQCWAGAQTRADYLHTLEQAGFENITILEESVPYPKGAVSVASWTIKGTKPRKQLNGSVSR